MKIEIDMKIEFDLREYRVGGTSVLTDSPELERKGIRYSTGAWIVVETRFFRFDLPSAFRNELDVLRGQPDLFLAKVCLYAFGNFKIEHFQAIENGIFKVYENSHAQGRDHLAHELRRLLGC